MLMHHAGFDSSARWRRNRRVAAARRLVVAVAAVLVIGTEVAATLSASAGGRSRALHAARGGSRPSPPPYGGEPQLPPDSIAPAAARLAAIRFVRDYVLWSSGRLAVIPAPDATPRVIGLLEEEGRRAAMPSGDMASTVRLAPSGARRYVVTSGLGNFLVGWRGSRWLVISLPGD